MQIICDECGRVEGARRLDPVDFFDGPPSCPECGADRRFVEPDSHLIIAEGDAIPIYPPSELIV